MNVNPPLFELVAFDPPPREYILVSPDIEGQRIELGRRKAALEDELDATKAELARLDALILADWEQNGTAHVKRGGSTLYMHNQRYARVLDEDALNAALAAAGLGSIVKETVNKMTLTATLKELDDTSGIPEALSGVVELNGQTVLRQKGTR